MIIHGTGDDNVHYQNFERMANELIKYNKLFDMMSYPMRTHSISERENTSIAFKETMISYWKRCYRLTRFTSTGNAIQRQNQQFFLPIYGQLK